jgi:hypothetical protein
LSSTPEGEWLDEDLSGRDERGRRAENNAEMVKLIRISVACCEANVDSRWELNNAVDRVQDELKAKENANDRGVLILLLLVGERRGVLRQ